MESGRINDREIFANFSADFIPMPIRKSAEKRSVRFAGSMLKPCLTLPIPS